VAVWTDIYSPFTIVLRGRGHAHGGSAEDQRPVDGLAQSGKSRGESRCPSYTIIHIEPLLVKKRGRIDRVLGRAAFAVGIAKGPAEAFGPLKAVLESISVVYAQYEVCSCSSVRRFSLKTPISRKPQPLRKRLKFYASASVRWRSFSRGWRVMKRIQNAVKDC